MEIPSFIRDKLPKLVPQDYSDDDTSSSDDSLPSCSYEMAQVKSLERFRETSSTFPLHVPRFKGDLSLGQPLGEGSFGIVRQVNNTDYVVKQLHSKHLRKGDVKRWRQAIVDFETEKRILACVHHPHIVQFYGTIPTDSSSFVMECLYDALEGQLDAWRRKHLQKHYYQQKNTFEYSKMDHSRLQIALEIASALKYLHENQIMHRDVKPGNIAFDKTGRAKLYDFGLARQLHSNPTNKTTLKHYTAACGSPRYMAPEVAKGEAYNESCDVYSFSLLLWELLTLEKPYNELSTWTMRQQVWCDGPQKRPWIHQNWPVSIQTILELSWSDIVRGRPSMSAVYSSLNEIVISNVWWTRDENEERRDCQSSPVSTKKNGSREGYTFIEERLDPFPFEQ